VADPKSSDRRADSTGGPIEGQQGSAAPGSGGSQDARAVSDRDQTLADADQTGPDSGQIGGAADQAQADRAMVLRQLEIGETAQSTATPAASREDIDREIDRARRANGVLAVACVEVVGLQTGSHADADRADDALLLRVVYAIQSRLRSYDLVVRLGGDAFLCVMGGATIQDAVVRFAGLQAALAAEPDPCEIRVGVAALAPEDSAAELVRRAVAELASGG
jgi:GGDEF domain-containing protein